jgi:hypothetical protein
MLRGAVFSEVLRAMSAPVVALATFRGSVGPWLRTGDLGAPSGRVEGSSEVAVPGATDSWVGVCGGLLDDVRECMGRVVFVVFVVVGAGAGAGAGRV